MAASTIDEGAGPLDSQAFQGALDNLSISLRFDAGIDSFSGSLATLTENRDRAFELLRLALTEPRFDEEPVERIRSQIVARLSRQSEDADYIAGRVLRRLMSGERPYARPRRGTDSSCARLTAHPTRTRPNP